MCERAVEKFPETLEYVHDYLKTQGMCEGVVEKHPYKLKFVPDHFKTKKMCKRDVEKYPWALDYVPDWFVTCEQLNLWHDYHHNNDRFISLYHNNDRFIKWCNGYKKRKDQKSSIKVELMAIAWHPSR